MAIGGRSDSDQAPLPDAPAPRRRVLGGLAALAALPIVGACTGGDTDDRVDGDAPPTDEVPAVELVRLFSSDTVIVAGIEQRLPFGVVDNGSPVLGDGQVLEVTVLGPDGPVSTHEVAGRVVLHDHPAGDADIDHEHADIVRYYPLRTTLPAPGIYDLAVTIAEQDLLLPVQAFDPTEVALPTPGDVFPPLDTPTLAEPGPMEPICTLFDGPCPFHDHTVSDVLAEGAPLAFLIASPAYCATSYCGPVLETLVESLAGFPSIRGVHLEVYENPEEVGGDLASPDLRPVAAFDTLRLTFEPSLFLVDRDGVLVDRIDNVYDAGELELALARIA